MAKWTRTHEAQRKRILELLHREAKPFDNVSEEAKAERRALPQLAWCKTYFPHYFSCGFAPFHRTLARTINEPGMPTFVAIFRGGGKSVICSLADPIYRSLKGERHYFLYGSQVQGLAVDLMDFVRIELTHNARLRCDYGEIRIDGPEDEYTVELEGRRGSVKFEAFGIGMSPRGRRHGAHRPDAFIGDDLEDAVLARNPKREARLWDWLMDEVVPALEPDVWTFAVSGTMFGPGCMIERAKEAAARTDAAGRALAKVFIQAAVDSKGRSVWPERFSNEFLDRVRTMVGVKNWNRNYGMRADDPTKPFQPDWLAWYDPADIDTGSLYKVAFLDPAISRTSEACPRALVVVGAERKTGDRYVLYAWIEHGSPREMIDKLFEVWEVYKPQVIGIEANGGYALLRLPLELEEAKRGVWLPVRYIDNTDPKPLRIESLAPFFERGQWLFPKSPSAGIKTLIDEFISYPDGFVDGPDACASADGLLPRGAGTGSGFQYKRLQKARDYSYV